MTENHCAYLAFKAIGIDVPDKTMNLNEIKDICKNNNLKYYDSVFMQDYDDDYHLPRGYYTSVYKDFYDDGNPIIVGYASSDTSEGHMEYVEHPEDVNYSNVFIVIEVGAR